MNHSTIAHNDEVRKIVVKMKLQGISEKAIQNLTNVASSTQRLYMLKHKTGVLSIKKPNRALYNN